VQCILTLFNRVLANGTWHTIKVELVDETDQPLKMRDQKGNDVKYQILTRGAYRATQQGD